MKKIITAVLFSTLLLLIGCSEDNSTTDVEPNDQKNEANNEEVTESESDKNDEEYETQEGEVSENEGGTFTLHSRQDQIDTINTGPIVMEIEQLNTASGELSGDLADFLESDHIEYIQMDLVVENTSDEDITFYSSQAEIATSTGEQLESDMWMSDHIEGDLMSGTKHSGSLFFILENSKAEDVESIRIKWSAPYNEDWEDVGEAVDIEISL
ncbi:protein of unknown function [Halolactibacillus halophilus]|uniref:SPBc2 prophage-derived uncharacterized lipoprotein YonS n=1 Tax=Halolactibacillus halophilus TaxID=306540 RepID=A0A1I5MCC3_9BACI|nr:DUF4352 domain-containing protein [Halolactibacillus halophilus]GEM02055.1 SPBc2 prophage-derived uncharacterized lipoprotein YonS [Halolactibacillus halophilus]SFP06651.1 protein of unknown function [Halolactibacillus halophilus]